MALVLHAFHRAWDGRVRRNEGLLRLQLAHDEKFPASPSGSRDQNVLSLGPEGSGQEACGQFVAIVVAGERNPALRFVLCGSRMVELGAGVC